MVVLKTKDLTKNYRQLTAVDRLQLELQKGCIFGILGPNGCGKTTTLGMILGIIEPSAGHFQWFEGKNIRNHRRRIGALLETPNFYPYLNAVKNLKIVARIKKSEEDNFDSILEIVGLKSRKLDKVSNYSLGMKQRLAIGAAMIGDPEVIILDEPTNGLDPKGIVEIRETINEIAKGGKTIIMASHILPEVQKICQEVLILKKGKTVFQGSISKMTQSKRIIEVGTDRPDFLKELLSGINQIKKIETVGNLIYLHTNEAFTTKQIGEISLKHQLVLSHLREREMSLEEEFLKLTK